MTAATPDGLESCRLKAATHTACFKDIGDGHGGDREDQGYEWYAGI